MTDWINRDDINQVTALAPNQLNSRATHWIWDKPAPPTCSLRRRHVYTV
ncbi:hypothetical protein O3Q52_26575 [Streptomyces sp. ActVer]|nr:hypothetical protein [Streptomyces sp. ActVer]MCZ4511681.1 hypothetical protein [Streptomyces sp. ActVer]